MFWQGRKKQPWKLSFDASNSQAQKSRGRGIEKQMFIKQSLLEVDTEKKNEIQVVESFCAPTGNQ